MAPARPLMHDLDAVYAVARALYEDLHAHPELSSQEDRTAATLASRFEALGCEVSRHIGGHGFVALLRNGAGPTIMWRLELDALPIEESTGLSYASRVMAPDATGRVVPVMHACGHDLHMAAGVGAAMVLLQTRDAWHGTLMVVGQPAEETGLGARAMLDDGLFTRFRKPTYALAIHDSDELPSGTVAYRPGPALANIDSVDIVIHGRGGHAASPNTTIDPIVIAARTILALQTVVSRETDPRDAAVISVGSIHGGATHNVIPSEVTLQLTLRSLRDDVRKLLLDATHRIVRSQVAAAGEARQPTVSVTPGVCAVYNDPAVTARVVAALMSQLGSDHVVEGAPQMAGDDFGEFSRAGVPSAMLRVGAVSPSKFVGGRPVTQLLSVHSAHFAPDLEPTLRTGIITFVTATLALMK
jgi:amidohydrolase